MNSGMKGANPWCLIKGTIVDQVLGKTHRSGCKWYIHNHGLASPHKSPI